MPSYKLSLRARDDIAAIATYTVDACGAEQAIIYRDGLIDAFNFLAQFPKAARKRREINPPVRAYPYRSHIIVYMVDKDDILILGVRHGREDWMSEAN